MPDDAKDPSANPDYKAWKASFNLASLSTSHEVSRVVRHTVLTPPPSDGSQFARALQPDFKGELSTQGLWHYPDSFDLGRWRIGCKCVLDPDVPQGILNIFLFPLPASWEEENSRSRRRIRAVVILRCSGSSEVLATREFSAEFPKDTGKWTGPRTARMHLTSVRSALALCSSSMGRLEIECNLIEFMDISYQDKVFQPYLPNVSIKDLLRFKATSKPDLRFLFSDMETIYDHRVLIERACPYFKTLLQGGFSESNPVTSAEAASGMHTHVQDATAMPRPSDWQSSEKMATIVINDLPREIFEEFLCWLHTGHLDPPNDFVVFEDEDYEAIEGDDDSSEDDSEDDSVSESQVVKNRADAMLNDSDSELSECPSSEHDADESLVADPIPVWPGAASLHRLKLLYKLADKYHLDALKTWARDGILRTLRPSNVMHELGHHFTEEHPELIDVYKTYALSNWADVVKSRGLAPAIAKLMERKDTRKAYIDMLQGTMPTAKAT